MDLFPGDRVVDGSADIGYLLPGSITRLLRIWLWLPWTSHVWANNYAGRGSGPRTLVICCIAAGALCFAEHIREDPEAALLKGRPAESLMDPFPGLSPQPPGEFTVAKQPFQLGRQIAGVIRRRQQPGAAILDDFRHAAIIYPHAGRAKGTGFHEHVRHALADAGHDKDLSPAVQIEQRR